jgi:hypothetical protein
MSGVGLLQAGQSRLDLGPSAQRDLLECFNILNAVAHLVADLEEYWAIWLVIVQYFSLWC